MEELFKDIPEWNEYQITSTGKVWSKNNNRFLSIQYTEYHYAKVELKCKGRYKMFLVHRLVANLFIPNPENKPVVNHKNSNKHDNSVENLEWCTYSENMFHSVNEGTLKLQRGSNSARAKLNEEQVLEIRKIRETSNLSCREIGEKYGVSGSTINDIVTRRGWTHV